MVTGEEDRKRLAIIYWRLVGCAGGCTNLDPRLRCSKCLATELLGGVPIPENREDYFFDPPNTGERERRAWIR